MADNKNDQSKTDPKTSYAGIVENRLVGTLEGVPSSDVGGGGGGKLALIWTKVERR